MSQADAVRLVTAISAASPRDWQTASMEIWKAKLMTLELEAAKEAVGRYIASQDGSFTIAGFMRTYEDVVRRNQPDTPTPEHRGKPSDEEVAHVKDLIQVFLSSRPQLRGSYLAAKERNEPVVPGKVSRMAQEPRRAPEDSF